MSILNKIFSWNKQPRTPYYGFSYGGAMPPERKTEDFLHAYGQIGWLFAVVSKIGVGCSGVKWRLFKGDERSERSGIGKHPVLATLDSFNPFQTGAEGIELTQIYLDLIGECFWVLNYNALGEPAEIWIPYPSKMSIVPDKQKFIKGYVYGAGQEAVPFELNEIIHFKYPNPLNQYRGMSPAQALAVDLDAEQYSGEWNRNFFYNSARPDGVIEFDYKLSDEQYDRLKKQWSEKYKGVNKAHQVGLLEGGGKYKQIQVSQKDMDFRALRLMNRDNILGVYGMPLSVMGITENVNKANAEAGDYTFARWLVKPRLDRMKNKLNEQFVTLFRRSDNLEIDYDEVVPETLEQKMQLAESGIRAGYLTINEARKLRGLDPLKPDMGDVLLVPLNLIPTPISGKPISAPAPAPTRAEEEPVEESYKGGEGSGNFGHEGRPGEVGGSGGGGGGGNSDKPSGDNPSSGGDGGDSGGKPYSSESRSSLKLSNSERQQLAKDNLYLHGTSSDFDEFKNDTGHGVIYVSDPSGGRITQAEHIADGSFGGRLVAVKVNDSKLTRFDPRNDIKAAELYKNTLGKDPTHDYIDYPDMGRLAPVAISAGYSDFRVYEPAVMGFSRAVSKPKSFKIVKEWRKKPYVPMLRYLSVSRIPKRLTEERKRAHWDLFAQKTERQEIAFKRVFEDIFAGQKKFVVEHYQKTGQLPDGLNDKQTAQKFQPVIELVYDSAFEDAVANKTVKQLDEFARGWIAERSLLLAKSINITTLESIRHELQLGFELGESIQQLTRRLEGYFEDNARMRAERLSRTEVITASNEGALHRYELEHIQKVEFYPAPDACPVCLSMVGEYDAAQSHGIITEQTHPNCRCTWLPIV